MKITGSITVFLPNPSISFYSKDKILKTLFLFILERFRQQFVLITLYEIFHNDKTNRGDRLQDPSTYENFHTYRQALMGFERSFVGIFLKWRTEYTSKIRETRQHQRKNSSLTHDIRTLFLTKSWHFFDPVAHSVGLSGRVRVEKFDLQKLENEEINHQKIKGSKARHYRTLAIDQMFDFKYFDLQNDNSFVRNFERLCSNYDSVDVYFVDWLNHNSVVSLGIIPLHKPIVVRVHSYEVFSYFAPLINYGRIDALIFISEGIKDIFLDLWGWLIPSSCQVFVCSNIRNYEKFSKSISCIDTPRRKTIGMVQYADEVKDFNFALETFKILYREDKSYRLLLAGKTLSESGAPRSSELLQELKSFPEGVILESGYQENISSVYNKVGFILSTSIREGSHESVIEGMLHGCVPVIRDWPLLSKVRGAARAFPGHNVHTTPEQIAEFILKNSCDFQELSARSRVAARSYFSSDLVDDYTNILLGVVKK